MRSVVFNRDASMLVLHYRGQGTAAFELFSMCMWLSLTEKCAAENVAFFLLPEPLCDPKICLKCVCDALGELTMLPQTP